MPTILDYLNDDILIQYPAEDALHAAEEVKEHQIRTKKIDEIDAHSREMQSQIDERNREVKQLREEVSQFQKFTREETDRLLKKFSENELVTESELSAYIEKLDKWTNCMNLNKEDMAQFKTLLLQKYARQQKLSHSISCS